MPLPKTNSEMLLAMKDLFCNVIMEVCNSNKDTFINDTTVDCNDNKKF